MLPIQPLGTRRKDNQKKEWILKFKCIKATERGFDNAQHFNLLLTNELSESSLDFLGTLRRRSVDFHSWNILNGELITLWNCSSFRMLIRV